MSRDITTGDNKKVAVGCKLIRILLDATLRGTFSTQSIDFGLSTLIANDCGELMGRGFLDATRLDRQVFGIARHRQRVGESRATANAIAAADRVRGIIKTYMNAC